MSGEAQDYFYSSADGLRLYCQVHVAACGGGVPVLCLPGLTRNHRDFTRLAPHLAAKHEVLALDLRGRGRSAWDPDASRYSISVYVQDVLTLLHARHARRVLVIGTSLGALMGMVLAATQRQRIAGVVLNDAGPELDPVGIRRIQSYAGKLPPVRSWEEAAAQTQSIYGMAFPDLNAARWLEYARHGYRENEQGVPVPDMDPKIAQALQSPAASGTGNLWSLFAQIRDVPMLVIRGALSDLLSVATVERMAREQPTLEQLTVANRGHAPLLDEPECLAAIEDFVTRHGRE